jgi:hemolysin III
MEWLHFREPVNTWTHLIWMLLAVPGTILLWQRARGDLPKQISLLIFGLGLIICFGFSSLYHGLYLSHDQLEPFITLDHIGIYFLIAASATGMAFSLLRGAWKWALLVGVWSAAAFGIVARLVMSDPPRSLDACIYVAMGWGMAACYPKLVQAVGHRAVRWIWIGGLSYTLGAMFYITRWPVIWPGVFAAHELLHICDMAGSLAHFWFVLAFVIPYKRIVSLPDPPIAISLATDQA